MVHNVAGRHTPSMLGVSVGSLYHHFRDKHSLAATVYLEHLQRFQRDLIVEL